MQQPTTIRTLSHDLSAAGAVVRRGVPLAELTTLRVGGPARLVADCPTAEVMQAVVRRLDAAEVPWLLVGGGSNLLVADEAFDGVVVRSVDTTVDVGPDRVRAAAGANWDAVVAAGLAAGLGGLECLSGIPGSAGATPVQNVGAYGVEISTVLRRVRLLDRAGGDVDWVAADRLDFGYRTSALKNNNSMVVLAADYALLPDGRSAPVRYRELAAVLGVEEGARLPAAQVRHAVLGLRASKGMVADPADHDTWSAGSFFVNPVIREPRLADVLAAIVSHTGVDRDAIPVYPAPAGGVKLSAGWLIERAGFGKGYPNSGAVARLSTKHALALTNRGGARASDLVVLARTVRDGVFSAFGVQLEPEPVLVGTTL